MPDFEIFCRASAASAVHAGVAMKVSPMSNNEINKITGSPQMVILIFPVAMIFSPFLMIYR
jgi:hypothetical protein